MTSIIKNVNFPTSTVHHMAIWELPSPSHGAVATRSYCGLIYFRIYYGQGRSERRRGLERGKTISRTCHYSKSNRRCCHLSFMNKSRQDKMHNSSLTIANNMSISSQTASKWKMIWCLGEPYIAYLTHGLRRPSVLKRN